MLVTSSVQAQTFTSEIRKIAFSDGDTSTTRLCLPQNREINTIVIVVHGTEDENVSVESVYDLQSRFDVCNKKNLMIHIFDKHNHDLNFQDWLIHKKWSEGFQKIFRVASII